jgi:dCMP deaminase
MDTALQKGSWSKDRSRKVGAVIVDRDNVEVSNGWNGFPRKIDDEIEDRHQRPAKYLWSEHSERNALYNAARKGRATAGCRIYQSMYPCAHCARGIIQSGIVEVITVEPNWDDATYAEEFAVTKEMLAEAGVTVRFMEGQTPVRADSLPPAPRREEPLGDSLTGIMGFANTFQKWIVRVFIALGCGMAFGAIITKYIHFPEWMFGAGMLLLMGAFVIDKME